MQKKLKLNKKAKIKAFFRIIILLLCLGVLFLEIPFEMNTKDKILYKSSQIFALFSVVIPFWILLSNRLKRKLPFFKKKTWWGNVFGILIIFSSFGALTSLTLNLQSDEFKINYQSYLGTQKNVITEEKSDLEEQELKNKLNDLTEENRPNIREFEIAKNLKVHYLNVGQGDSIFLELPNSETMLIDAAEKSEENKIKSYIENLGYAKIDYVVATHPHADHIGGLATIIKSFDIKNIYMPKVVSTSKTYENLLSTIASKNLKVKNAKAGISIINQNDLKIEIISPKKDTYNNLNNYSAVIKLIYKNCTFLFMGDAETQIEDEIQYSIKADVIKVGHHGSNTSSGASFVQKVHPKYAIISVGKENKYHPNKDVLECWKAVGAEIYRTDEDGTVIIESDGNLLAISSKNGKNNNTKIEKIENEESKVNFQEEFETVNSKSHSSINQEKKNEITLINFTEVRKKGQNATIKIKGMPNTQYTISLFYTNKKSSAKGLEKKESDENGIVSWTWRIGTRTTPGDYQILISDGKNKAEYALKVTEN